MMRTLALLTLLAGCATQLDLTDDAGTANGDLAGAGSDAALVDLAAGSCLSASPSTGVTCGTTTCSVTNGEPCCLSGSSQTCGPGGCPPGDDALFCDGPEDCTSGRVCCYQPMMGAGSAASCHRTCLGRTVCHSASDCPKGSVCRHEASFPDGVGLCRSSC